jgi:hypothetical protein
VIVATEEKKETPAAQTPVQPTGEKKEGQQASGTEQPKTQEAPKPTGLDALTPEQLEALYDKSPDLFKKVKEKVAAKPEGEKEKPKGDEGQPKRDPQSAAPVAYEGQEIKLPQDLQVDREVLKSYLDHAKSIGLNPQQVQKELDFQFEGARQQMKRQQAQQTAQEQDAANVAKLKQDKEFGAKYEENMEIARRAAKEFADPELLERLKTSDPVLVKHFWKIGMRNAEDHTRGAPNRSGEEDGQAEQEQADYLKKRYPNSPEMFQQPIRG